MTMGRGRSHLRFDAHTVTKKVVNAWEPLFMRRFPEVFVEVKDIKHHEFTMVRLNEPDYLEPRALLEASSSLKTLWNTPWRGSDKDWREKLRAHLKNLRIITDAEVDALISQLRDVEKPCWIHGDPTLANLLQSSNGYHWIDPLLREYIPGDPHVDLGKMYQSCLGYEQVLLNKPSAVGTLSRDPELLDDIAELYSLDRDLGLAWCAVHYLRLMPYQEEKDKTIFHTILRALLTRIHR